MIMPFEIFNTAKLNQMTKKQKARYASLMPGGVPKMVRCCDNGGGTLDRYTVIFTGRYKQGTGGAFWYLGMSENEFFTLKTHIQ